MNQLEQDLATLEEIAALASPEQAASLRRVATIAKEGDKALTAAHMDGFYKGQRSRNDEVGALKAQMSHMRDEWLKPLQMAFELSTRPMPMILRAPADDKQDAERYRWLRDQNADLRSNAFLVLSHDEECPHCDGAWVGTDLDAAIDGAMHQPIAKSADGGEV